MPIARWFLAHKKGEEDSTLKDWTTQLVKQLNYDGWDVIVISGKQDYETRAHSLGGWRRWCQDVPKGCHYDNSPLFHGVIVPVELDEPHIGRATSTLVEGFMDSCKHAWAWSPTTREFAQISGVELLGKDDWKSWATLSLRE